MVARSGVRGLGPSEVAAAAIDKDTEMRLETPEATQALTRVRLGAPLD